MSAESSPPLSDQQLNLERGLIDGGLTLIGEKSGLAQWSQAEPRLIATPYAEFEAWLLGRGDFARVASWVLFSVGAEYLAKGVCLVHGACPAPILKNGYLDMDTLAPYYNSRAKKPGSPYLGSLPMPAPSDNKSICKAFRRLSVFRNRDLHTLNIGVRTGNLPDIAKEFVPAFNLLLGAIPPASALGKIIVARWQVGLSESTP